MFLQLFINSYTAVDELPRQKNAKVRPAVDGFGRVLKKTNSAPCTTCLKYWGNILYLSVSVLHGLDILFSIVSNEHPEGSKHMRSC